MKSIPMTATPRQSYAIVRWLALVGWFFIALFFVVLFLVDLGTDYSQMQVPCTNVLGMGGGCNFLAISAAEVAVLESWGLTLQSYAAVMIMTPVITLLVYLGLGFLILWQQRMSRIGLTVSLALIVMPFAILSASADWAAIHPNLFLPGMAASLLGTAIMLLFLYLMPNGRFSPRWAYVPLLSTLLLVTILTFDFNNIIDLPNGVLPFLNITIVGLVLFGGGSQVYRYLRDANTVERQQTQWIIFAVVIFAASIILWVLIFGSALAIPAGRPRLLTNLGAWSFTNLVLLPLLPAAITVAILRYKLWNIDIIISRTLVYGGLTLMVVLIYTLLVGGLGLLFQGSGNFVISLLATGLIAVAFNPVRERLQRGVNRLMFGQRDDPYAVLSHLSQQLQGTAVPSETLSTIVQTIADTLKLPYVAIELTEQAAQVGQAFVGLPVGETVELPLHYQKERVGRLLVSPRAANERFTPQETQLLADIAAQTAPVASATRLTMALQRSREKLVLTREEERRRIRRDLHDGFGPTMASQTLKLDTVLELLLDDDPQAAVKYVQQLKGQTQQMVADIRQLVYELYPSVLDELGLLEALRIHVAQMRGVNGQLTVSIEAAPDPLPPLPAAIEVAAYRIVLEAVTNVVRHAQAARCVVWLAVGNGHSDKLNEVEPLSAGRLQLTVTDDGIGLPANLQRGVGLTSMRERAEELGGSCEIGLHGERGTRITAVLPYAEQNDTNYGGHELKP